MKRLFLLLILWALGLLLAFQGAAYTKTHPRISNAQGWDVLANMWRDFVAATTGANSAVIVLILIALTLIALFTKKKSS